MSWQPIETAPSDGTWILVTVDEPKPYAYIPAVAFCKNGKWYSNGDDSGSVGHTLETWKLKWWMPLPPHPNGKSYFTAFK